MGVLTVCRAEPHGSDCEFPRVLVHGARGVVGRGQGHQPRFVPVAPVFRGFIWLTSAQIRVSGCCSRWAALRFVCRVSRSDEVEAFGFGWTGGSEMCDVLGYLTLSLQPWRDVMELI